jgi:ABC-type transport system involved in cytochrome c biogenesis permease subunit
MDEDSLYKALGTWLATFLAAVAAIILYIFLDDKPSGFQIATLITYTGAVFFFIFSHSRGWKGYSLRQKAVQRELPRLLCIHVAFLGVLFAVLALAFWIRPRLSLFWIVQRGSTTRHSSFYEDVLILLCTLVGMTQILISRGILGRAVRDENERKSRWGDS